MGLTEWGRAELSFPCHYCGAAIGDLCMTESGHPAVSNHRSRYDSVRSIITLAGYEDDLYAAWRHRRAVERAIRELHTSIDGMDSIDPAWMRIRLAELLAIRPVPVGGVNTQ